MEEVFLKVADMGEENLQKVIPEKKENPVKINGNQEDPVNIDNFKIEDVVIKDSKTLFTIHVKILMWKKWLCSIRDRKSLYCDFLVPIILIIFGLITATLDFSKNE